MLPCMVEGAFADAIEVGILGDWPMDYLVGPILITNKKESGD